MDSLKIFTVSEINASIRGILESQFPFISIVGEISNLRRPFSGHMYFTLKDEKAQIKAVLFKMQQRYLGEEPADGQHVVCRGRLSVYEPRGDYQIIVDTIDFRGKGLLHLEFERLKKKLAGEGLFNRAAKKPIPLFPEHVTLVTSPEGAAVHDFIRVARTRCPQAGITVYPVAVQGDHAAQEITRAIAAINDSIETSLIVLCRGGGSLEDLWAFNEETSVGDVRRFDLNNGYAIVQLTATHREGLKSVEDASVQVLPKLRKEKKAAQIIAANQGKSLEEIASSNGVVVSSASALNAKSPTIAGAGREPLVVGMAVTMDPGATSGLLEGESGVFKMEVTNKEEAPDMENYTPYANTLENSLGARVTMEVYNALRDKAEVVDNRAVFY